MKRNLFTLFLALVSITCWAHDFEKDGIYYNITNSDKGYVAVTFFNDDFNSYSGDVVIPATVEYKGIEYIVDGIGGSAFRKCSALISVTIPNSVTSIGYAAFYDCSRLTSMTIPNRVTSIGNYAFAHCSGLTSVSIPNSLTSIGGDSFMGCDNLPVYDNIRYADTFLIGAVDRTCTTAIIKDGTTWIGSSAFSGCSSLTSVTIPNSVTHIEYTAFSGCDNLPIYDNIRYADTYLIEAVDKKCTTAIIKDGTTLIGNSAFRSCSALSYVAIPNSVTRIGKNAFYGWSRLTALTIGNSVTDIGDYSFTGCYRLIEVTIGDSVTSIGNSAFVNCSGLTSITIPNSVTSIGSNAFSGCSNLIDVHVQWQEPLKVAPIFNDVPMTQARLFVPTGTYNKYAVAEIWKDFSQIIEEEVDDINGIFIDEKPSTSIYDLNGRRLNEAPVKGIYIQNGKKIMMK